MSTQPQDGVVEKRSGSKKDLLITAKRPASHNLVTLNAEAIQRKDKESDNSRNPSPKAELRQFYKPYLDEINKMTSKEDAFKSQQFDHELFVDQLTRKLVPKELDEKNPIQSLDVDMLLFCLEEANEKLKKIQNKVGNDIEVILGECQKSERDFKASLIEFNSCYEKEKEAFAQLDANVDTISKRTVRIGRQLERLEQEKRNATRSLDVLRLIDSFNSLTNPSESDLLAIFDVTGGDEGVTLALCEQMRQYYLIAQELKDYDSTTKAHQCIEYLHALMTRNLTKEMQRAMTGEDDSDDGDEYVATTGRTGLFDALTTTASTTASSGGVNRSTGSETSSTHERDLPSMARAVSLLEVLFQDDRDRRFEVPFAAYYRTIPFCRQYLDFDPEEEFILDIVGPYDSVPVSMIDMEEISLDGEKSPRKPLNLVDTPVSSSFPPSSLSNSAHDVIRKLPTRVEKGRRLLSSRFRSRLHGKKVTGDEFEIYQLLNGFFDELTKEVLDQKSVVDQVFVSNHATVFESLVTNLLTDIVQPYLHDLLAECQANQELYLKAAAHLMMKMQQLVEELSSILSRFGWKAFDDNVFHQTRQLYVDYEIATVVQFLSSHVLRDIQRQAAAIEREHKAMEERKTFPSAGVGVGEGSLALADQVQALKTFAMSNIEGLGFLNVNKQVAQARITPEITQAFISRFGEAVHRCILLIEGGESLASNLSAIFVKTVVEEFGEKYLLKAFEKIVKHLTTVSIDSKDPPNIADFFTACAVVNKSLVNVHNKFCREIWPKIEHTGDKYSYDAKHQLFERFEDLILKGLTHCLTNLLIWVKKILKTMQKNDDFTNQSHAAQSATKASRSVCAFIQESYKVIAKSLDGKNLEAFLIEFGEGLKNLILSHIQGYHVDTSGGIIVMMDFESYRETVALWRIESLNESFSVLSYIEKLYLMDDKSLQDYVDTIPPELLSHEHIEPFISKRRHNH